MKKIVNLKKSLALFAILFVNIAFSQAKKPTIMIVPSDVWCNTNGYMMEYNNQGTKVKIPNYKKVFQENMDIKTVISKINTLMAERGFPLKDMESAIKTLEAESAENAMTAKSGIAESPIDKLKKVAKADIIIQLTWATKQVGPKNSVNFILQGIDSYTDKQIAAAQGTGAPSFSAETSVLLEEAVLAHVDNFNAQLQKHFDDMFENGREIIVRIKKFNGWSGNLEKQYDGQDLSTIIEDWISQNTVKGRFNTSDVTENSMLFEQVRIPLYDSKNRATDARGFLKGLQDYLRNAPYSIPNKLTMKGLGQAVIILGEK
ncbi:DUF6175 family protein [Flavobacterium pectinovorum]|uniref:DUF6175 family protein n=1 Tax=Flavobacterium pectinovorum TaxID=29533 RepID=UPI001FAD54CD|nr:DUF6175 family protein [Flavobacterium pectinovorum]MCI9846769.1 hypothetical protein [Flavobacterium pectinovorum]